MNDSSNRFQEQFGAEVTILQSTVSDAAHLHGVPDWEADRTRRVRMIGQRMNEHMMEVSTEGKQWRREH